MLHLGTWNGYESEKTRVGGGGIVFARLMTYILHVLGYQNN